MTTLTIIAVIIFAVNCLVLCAAIVLLAGQLGRIECKIDELADHAKKAKSRMNTVYLDLLCRLRRQAIDKGMHEDAQNFMEEINKIIKDQ